MSLSATRVGPRGTLGRLEPLWAFLFRYGPPRWTQYVLKNWSGRRLVTAIPYIWLLVFFLVPFLIVLKISFAEFSPLGRPPYEPVFRWLDEGAIQIKLLMGSYQFLLSESLYIDSYLYSLKVAALSTLMCLFIGYPIIATTLAATAPRITTSHGGADQSVRSRKARIPRAKSVGA